LSHFGNKLTNSKFYTCFGVKTAGSGIAERGAAGLGLASFRRVASAAPAKGEFVPRRDTTSRERKAIRDGETEYAEAGVFLIFA
jgi:hypothetical protein